MALCDFLKKEYKISVKDVVPKEGKSFSKIFDKEKKELWLSDYVALETKNYMLLHKSHMREQLVKLIIIYQSFLSQLKSLKNLHKLRF